MQTPLGININIFITQLVFSVINLNEILMKKCWYMYYIYYIHAVASYCFESKWLVYLLIVAVENWTFFHSKDEQNIDIVCVKNLAICEAYVL